MTCTFTNTASHPVVLTKTWVNGIAGDSVDLTITDGTATATGSSTAPATTSDATLPALAGDTVALAETFTTGNPANYATTLGCDHGVTVTDGSFTVPSSLAAGTPITCRFTNARRSATLTLEKFWENGADGDTADLAIDAATSGAGFTTATAPPPSGNGLSTDKATATVFSGETVDLDETFGAGNTGTYDTGLTCTDQAGLTYTAGDLSGTYTVPATPGNVVCRFTNTRTSAELILQKEWVNGAAGDQAGLTITGSDPATFGSATSTATGAAGSEIDTGNRATATIFSGETVTVGEDLPPGGVANTGSYTSTISCNPLGIREGRGGQAASGTVPDNPVPVLCTVTNTRTSATLVLQKRWVVGASGDTADLSIGGDNAGSGFATATVPDGGTGLSIDKASVTLLSGTSVDLSEVLGAGNTGSYSSEIGCNQPGLTPDADGQGGTYAVPATPVPVTCTISNTRTSASITLQKRWVDGATDDTADLSVTGADVGSATSTATGAAGSETDTDNQADARVFSGETVDLAEVLGAGNTGSYTSAIACDQPGLDPDANGQGGTFTVPATPVPVTCTITNTRTSAVLILQKEWVNGATDDTADLSVTGSDPGTAGSATSTATGASGSETDTDNQANARVFSGETVDLAEVLGSGNTGTYGSIIACDQPGLTPDANGQGGTFAVPATPLPVTCTITNTRTSAMIVLQKEWVNGAAGDTADSVGDRCGRGLGHLDGDRRGRVGDR